VKVLVLGAGVIGVAGAWYLADAGHEVTVVDRRAEPGLETSFANGGQISASHAEPWAKPEIIPKILRWLGREDAPLLFRPRADWALWRWGLGFLRESLPGRFEANSKTLAGLAAYSRACLRSLREATGIQYDALSRGILHFCTSEKDFEALAGHAESMKALGIERELKSATQCLEIEPALSRSLSPVAGGVFMRDDESGDARKFTQALAARSAARGVRFLTEKNIDEIETEGGRVAGIRCAAERLEADAYIVSLGSYSPLLLKPLGIRIPVYPLKGYSITLPLDGKSAEAAPTVSLTDEAHKIVLSRLGNRLRAAGTAELAGYDAAINHVRCDALLARVRHLFPALEKIEPSDRWTGLRPATPDNVPVIGRTRLPNLFLNTGHGTLGWTLACGSGRVIADLVSGRKPEVDFRFHPA
jgi:D-amino-acid dehydrogenase